LVFPPVDALRSGLGLEIYTKSSDKNVVPGSTKYADPGTCLEWKNHNKKNQITNGVYCYCDAILI